MTPRRQSAMGMRRSASRPPQTVSSQSPPRLVPLLLILALLLAAATLAQAACIGGGLPTTTSSSGGPGPPAPPAAAGIEPTPRPSTGADPLPVKIGALFPLTGDLAAEGQSALRGMRVAVEEVNAAGGIASLGGALLTVVEADSRGDPATGESQLEPLAKAGVSAFVGTGQSTVALRATAGAERLRVPFVVSMAAADEVTERGLAYTFRLCPAADRYAADQVHFLAGLGAAAGAEIHKVALLHEEGEFGRQTAEQQRRHLAAAGIEVAVDVEYPAKRADVQQLILRIRGSGAQAVLTATFPGDAGLIAEALAGLGVRLPVIDAAGGFLAPRFLDEVGEAAEGLLSVAPYAAGSAPSRQLESRWTASDAPLDADALYAYQAVWLLADAIGRAGSTDGEALRDALARTALTGTHLVLPQEALTFDDSGQNQEARLLVVQVQDGKLAVVWPESYAQAKVRP